MPASNPAQWRLDHADMDATHEEFLSLLQGAMNATTATLPECLARLVNHTELHFTRELQWMQNSGFPALAEHRDEHQRILGELHFHQQRVAQARSAMARVYLRERLPEWFALHVTSMDSALACHLHKTALTLE